MTHAGVVALLALAACLEPGSFTCPDGTLCAADLVCAPVHGCAAPERVAACEMLSDGDDCAVDDIPGVCVEGVCTALFCGDGLRTGNEQCDPGDGAESTCRERGFYQGGTIGCADNCTWDTATCAEFCGDGSLQVEEELCEVGIEPAGTCLLYGFDVGRLGCAGCGVEFSACHVVGWTPADVSGGGGLVVDDLAQAGDSLVAVGQALVTGAPFAFRWDGAWLPLGDLAATVPSHPVAVAAAGRDVIWVTGGPPGPGTGYAARWDGEAWQMMEIPEPGRGIWVRSPDDVFVLGETGVHHLDGGAWSFSQLDPSFTGRMIWGRADGSEVYASGDSGDLYRFDGVDWGSVTTPPGDFVLAMAETPDGVLWAASLAAGVYRWSGSEWLDAGLPVTLYGGELHVDGDGELFVLARWSAAIEFSNWEVMHYRDGRWHVLTDPIAQSLRGDARRTFGGFGHQMLVFAEHRGYQYGGSSWWDMSPFPEQMTFGGQAFAAGDQIWLVPVISGPALHAVGGDTWSEEPVSGDRIGGAGEEDVYVLDSGTGELSHWDGGTWSSKKPLTAPNILDMAVRGRDDVYLVSNNGGRLQHWDGSDLAVVDDSEPGTLVAVSCQIGGRCAAVGSEGRFWSNDPAAVPPDGSYLTAVWVAPTGEIFAGDVQGEIWLYAGGRWRAMANDGVDAISRLGGTSAGDVFASVGYAAALLHYDGADTLEWTPVRTRMHEDPLSTIRSLAASGDDLLLIGESPALVRLERTYRW